MPADGEERAPWSQSNEQTQSWSPPADNLRNPHVHGASRVEEPGNSQRWQELASHCMNLQQQLSEKDERICSLEKELKDAKEVNKGILKNDAEVRSLEEKLKNAEAALRQSVARETFFMSQLEMMSKAALKEFAGGHDVASSQQISALEARVEAMGEDARRRERALETKVNSFSARLEESAREKAGLVELLEASQADVTALTSQLATVDGKLREAELLVSQIEQESSEIKSEVLALKEASLERTAACQLDEVRAEVEKMLSDHSIKTERKFSESNFLAASQTALQAGHAAMEDKLKELENRVTLLTRRLTRSTQSSEKTVPTTRQESFEARKKKLVAEVAALRASAEYLVRQRRQYSRALPGLDDKIRSGEKELERKLQNCAAEQAEAVALVERVLKSRRKKPGFPLSPQQKQWLATARDFMSFEKIPKRAEQLCSLGGSDHGKEVFLMIELLEASQAQREAIALQLECAQATLSFLEEEQRSRAGPSQGDEELSELRNVMAYITQTWTTLQDLDRSKEQLSAELAMRDQECLAIQTKGIEGNTRLQTELTDKLYLLLPLLSPSDQENVFS